MVLYKRIKEDFRVARLFRERNTSGQRGVSNDFDKNKLEVERIKARMAEKGTLVKY